MKDVIFDRKKSTVRQNIYINGKIHNHGKKRKLGNGAYTNVVFCHPVIFLGNLKPRREISIIGLIIKAEILRLPFISGSIWLTCKLLPNVFSSAQKYSIRRSLLI